MPSSIYTLSLHAALPICLRAAFASCDWNMLRERMGVSCAYVEDATRRPSGRIMFERLAVRAPRARFHVFHGTDDWNTPVGPVRSEEHTSELQSQSNLVCRRRSTLFPYTPLFRSA